MKAKKKYIWFIIVKVNLRLKTEVDKITTNHEERMFYSENLLTVN